MPLRQFNHQVEKLIQLGYPELLGIQAQAFRDLLESLKGYVPKEVPDLPDLEIGRVPFVIVVHSQLAPVRITLPRVQREGKAAFERLYPIEPERFKPIQSVNIPEGDAYLTLDVDRGKETLNVTPEEALRSICGDGRSPLTIEEGVALLTQYPEFLRKNDCFSLLASRCGDQRVPALWLSKGRPKLGWCWAGNPHTWLGSGSCGARAGVVAIEEVAHA